MLFFTHQRNAQNGPLWGNCAALLVVSFAQSIINAVVLLLEIVHNDRETGGQ